MKQQKNPPMIADRKALQHIRNSWETVRILEARINTTLKAGLFSLVPMATNFQEVPESLLLLFATFVLEDTLQQFYDQGVFGQKKPEGPKRLGLKRLMEASKDALCWQNFGKIKEIKNRRDGVAHHHKLLRSGQCTQYLNAIEKELLTWGVLEHPIKGTYEVSLQPTSG
jgi:hypothetical protein